MVTTIKSEFPSISLNASKKRSSNLASMELVLFEKYPRSILRKGYVVPVKSIAVALKSYSAADKFKLGSVPPFTKLAPVKGPAPNRVG